MKKEKMNERRRYLTACVAIVWFFTIIIVPREISSNRPMHLEWMFVLKEPDREHDGTGYSPRFDVLMTEWAGISIVYGILFLCLRRTKNADEKPN